MPIVAVEHPTNPTGQKPNQIEPQVPTAYVLSTGGITDLISCLPAFGWLQSWMASLAFVRWGLRLRIGVGLCLGAGVGGREGKMSGGVQIAVIESYGTLKREKERERGGFLSLASRRGGPE